MPACAVNNLAWQSTRVEVDYHDFKHNELYTWDSATFTPVDDKKHEYVIRKTKGTAVE